VVERICAGPLPAHGPRTITDARRLRRELDRIRAGGVAYDCEESGRGIGGLAVAVPGTGCAVAVTGRVSVLDPRAAGPALHVAARALGRETAQSRT
jgi:IclR family transcriptional regulator, acetate operon repressor